MYYWLSQSHSSLYESHQNARLEPIIPFDPLGMNEIYIKQSIRPNTNRFQQNIEGSNIEAFLAVSMKQKQLLFISLREEEVFIGGN